MKIKHIKRLGCLAWLIGVLAAILVYLFCVGISWIAVCGIVKLITLCFGLEFNWLWATGVWLIIVLLHAMLSN